MLSVVITTWNEEENLPRAVASVKGFADEIVVVDTESTDRTVEIAKKLGCKVYSHKNTGIVEPVRNFSIAKARGDWVLLLDADEEITTALAKKIQEIVKNQKGDYFRIPRKSIIFGKWIKSAHWWPDYVYRLFRKGSITWADTIHSIPETTGIGEDLPAKEEFSILHHHYSSIRQFIFRMDRYTDFQFKSKIDSGYVFTWTDLLVAPINEFINQYFARAGFSQGIHGLALSLLQSFSEFTLYLKLWEQTQFLQSDINPNEINHILKTKSKEFTWWDFQRKINTSIWPISLYWKIKRRFNG